MIRIRFHILAKPWDIRLLSKKEYRAKNGKGSLALTRVHKRRIDVSAQGFDFETVVHELVHAYLSELCTFSADFDVNALEEIFAEMLAKRGHEILSLGQVLLERLQKGASS